MQVPLTYRNEELPGAQAWFIGTMEHGVLGTRWVYDAMGDPVYRGELARVILTGDTQVRQWIEIDGVLTERESTARVVGSGSETAPAVDSVVLELIRVPGGDETTGLVLTGTWTDSPEPTVLAIASSS
jgi:Maltokinase N-terminal cap domain